MLLPWTVATVIAGRIAAVGRVLLGYAGLVMIVGLTLTFSRGGWLASGIGLGCVLLVLTRHRDYRKPALACMTILVLAAGVVFMRAPVMQQRLENAHDLNPTSRNSRPNIWRAAVGMWRDHPWLGVGPAHFSVRFKQYRTHWAHGEPYRAHNDYLNTLSDWGLAGTTVIAIPWVLLGYGVARTLRQVRRDPGNLEAKRSRRYAFVLGGAGGLVALLVHSFFDFNFHIPANAMVAVTWMALLAGYSRYATDNWWVSSGRPWRLAVIALIALPLLGTLLWDLSRRGRETLHLVRAGRGPALSDGQLIEYKAAWKIEPRNARTAAHIGEVLRRRSFEGLPEHKAMAREALEWFTIAARIDPFHPVYRFSAGMCLDWLEEYDRADRHFEAALALDPEGRITSYYMGWHQLQLGKPAAAREWFVKSVSQGWPPYQPAVDALARLETSPPLTAPPPVQPSEQP
jgi:tetratricopeptide (TPR) repeat protein